MDLVSQWNMKILLLAASTRENSYNKQLIKLIATLSVQQKIEVEKMDFSNCYDSGDRFCDTRPDYLNYRWACAPDSLSVTVQKDPNGVEFRSDATLYMSYSLDVCSNRFTDEQIEAMRTNFQFKKAVEKFSKVDPENRCGRLSDFVNKFVT